jgi:signal transduction histidine kinase
MEFYRLGRTLESGETRWTRVYEDPVTHVRMITVVSPIHHNGRWIGVASIDLDLGAHSQSHIKELSNPDQSYLMMVDKEGKFIGKSTLVRKRIQAENLASTHPSKSAKLIDLVEPILKQYQNKTTPNLKNDIQSSLFLLEDDPLLDSDSVVVVYHFFHTGWNLIIGTSKKKVLAQNDQTFFTVIGITVILTLLAMLAGYLLLGQIFVKPIQSINKQLKENLNRDGARYHHLHCSDKGEIGSLVQNLNARTTDLQEARKREKRETERRIINEKMLVQQSKMAAMGEMMDAAAHQWKQPLNALSMYSELLRSDFEEGIVDQDYIESYHENIQIQIQHMTTTLDAFRSFFRPNKENQHFRLLDTIESVLFLMKDELMKNSITVTIEQKDLIEIIGSENEFKHLILNIISNAKDAFNDNHIEKRKITIRLIDDKKSKRVEIEDNAGGIPENIIDHIFKANITTKAEGKGTGIGLYMSTKIAEKHHAVLSVENRNGGACFIVKFDESGEDHL